MRLHKSERQMKLMDELNYWVEKKSIMNERKNEFANTMNTSNNVWMTENKNKWNSEQMHEQINDKIQH